MDLLTRHQKSIVDDLDPKDVYDDLVQKRILSPDEIESIETKPTRREKARELIFVLRRKRPHAFDVFKEALRIPWNHLHLLLSLDPPWAPTDVQQDIIDDLKTLYSSKLRKTFMCAWLQEVSLNLKEVFVRLWLKTNEPFEQGKEVSQDEMFMSHESASSSVTGSTHEHRPKRLLVEGDPGIGKSTLCQKLAFMWSTETCNPQCVLPCIHKFQLVINLTAADFIGHTDIASVVGATLLTQDHSKDSKEMLNDTLKNSKVLFIVDAFDEGCTNNGLLLELIKKQFSRHTTVLVTSRPNYLRDMLKDFDSVFSIKGFNSSQRREYVEKFEQHNNLSSRCLEHLLDENDATITSLCSTPLNMAILCQLCMRSPHEFKTQSRTGVYQSVHSFILDKTSQRLGLSCEEIEMTLIHPLCKLSFEAYMKGDVSFSEGDLERACRLPEKVCQVGYLVKQIRMSCNRLQAEQRLSFSHRTFQEFLSAMNLTLMSDLDRNEWLTQVDLKDHESIISFLLGLLANDEGTLVQVIVLVLQHTGFSFVDSFHKYQHWPQSHLLVRCLSELTTLPSWLRDVIIEHHPSQVYFDKDGSPSSLKGIVEVLRFENMPAQSITLSCECSMNNKKHLIHLLNHAVTLKCLNAVELQGTTVHDLPRLLDAMRVGQSDSCVKHVKINPKFDDEEHNFGPEELPFGKEVVGMELIHCSRTRFTQKFLRAATEKSLTTLKILYCKFDDECFRLMSRLLKNQSLQSITIVPDDDHMKTFQCLPLLANLKELSCLEVRLGGMTKEEKSRFEGLLRTKKLHKLALLSCDFSRELCDALKCSFRQMSSLDELCIEGRSDKKMGDPKAFNKIISATQYLHLHSFCLEWVDVDKNCITNLCQAIQQWPDLRELKMYGVAVLCDPQLNNTAPELYRLHSFKKLFGAISSCRWLKIVSLRGMDLDDDVMPYLCEMLTSLEDVEQLNLWGNNLTATALAELSKCLQRRQKKLFFLDVSKNEGREDEKAVLRLKSVCVLVEHIFC